jgi:DNA-binding CsgD family transcriptional regulator
VASEEQERFRQLAERLTPREWRVLALVVEGRSTQQACESIGIAPGTFESHKQAIRRKLGVPRGKRLEAYLREFSEELPVEVRPEKPAHAAPPEEYADRRIRWLLRLTLDELNEVASNASMRAQLLGQTVRRIRSSEADEAKSEIDDLQFVSSELRAQSERLLREIRERNAAPRA